MKDTASEGWWGKPLYATWVGRVLWLFFLVLPDIWRGLFPEYWSGSYLRWGWYAILLVVLAFSYWKSRAAKNKSP